MPALVKSSVGSSPGTSDDECTRVCPLRSKYCRNFSRSSAPVMAANCITRVSVIEPEADALADDARHDRRGIAATQQMVAQPRAQLARRPVAAREEIDGGEPRGPRVESSARTARGRYDLLKKELPVGDTGGRSSRFCSNDCSPVEKMPRTLRSKSSAFVAASRAVSYEMMPSR